MRVAVAALLLLLLLKPHQPSHAFAPICRFRFSASLPTSRLRWERPARRREVQNDYYDDDDYVERPRRQSAPADSGFAEPTGSSEAEELRRMPRQEDLKSPSSALSRPSVDDYYEDEEEWDDEYDYEYDEYDEYDEYEDETRTAGNFWSNPSGGLDPYPSSESGRSRSRTRRRMPPSTGDPQPDTKRRGRSRSRSRSEDRYGRPPSRRRSGAVQKTPFRSGTPPPPPVLKNIYDRFFWYGFDPSETTSSTDRTMFGGTKGKFSGLDAIRSVEGLPAPRRTPRGDNERGRRGADDMWDDDWDEEDELDDLFDDDEYFSEDRGIRRSRAQRDQPEIPRPMLPGLSMEEKRSTRPPPPRSRRRARDDDSLYDQYGERRASSRRSRRSGRANANWAANEVSSWFDDGDNYEDDEYSGDDRYDQPLARNGQKRGRKRPKGRRMRGENSQSILGAIDSAFGFDARDLDRKSMEYEEKIGRAPPPRDATQREGTRGRRRAGYAYRFTEEDDDGAPPVAEYGASISAGGIGDDAMDAAIDPDIEDGVIDTSAEDVTSLRRAAPRAKRSKKKRRRRSWEDRESEDIDRVPPSGVQAWGPEGEVMGGIDARTHAALMAMKDIQEAEKRVEEKEELVVDAEERVLVLKADAAMQKKLLMGRSRRGDPRKLRAKNQQTRMAVEDAARVLRRVRTERDMMMDVLEDLEDRHWLLLRQLEGDKSFADELFADELFDHEPNEDRGYEDERAVATEAAVTSDDEEGIADEVVDSRLGELAEVEVDVLKTDETDDTDSDISATLADETEEGRDGSEETAAQ